MEGKWEGGGEARLVNPFYLKVGSLLGYSEISGSDSSMEVLLYASF